MSSTLRAYGRALLHARRPVRLSGPYTGPRLAVTAPETVFSSEWIRELHELFGSPRDAGVPLTAPHIMAGGPQLEVVTHELFPLRILGAVHVRSSIEQHGEVEPDRPYLVTCALEGFKAKDKGTEHTLLTTLEDDGGRVLWEGRSINLTIDPKAQRGGRSRAAQGEVELPKEVERFRAPADIGRRYGAVSSDRNPIHMSPLTARLFGFKRAIAHGMWNLGRCLAAVGATAGRPGDRLDVRFKRPLFLPGEVSVRRASSAEGQHILAVRPDEQETFLEARLSRR